MVWLNIVLDAGKWLLANGPLVVSSIIGVLSALIALCLVIPGEQPEKSLQAIVDFLSKFSSKPSDK